MTRRRIAAALLAVVLALQIVAIVRRADREPHQDESEYLHAAWLMSHGERLYTSFFEHHPPFLFAAFRAIASEDIPAFFVRARLLSGAFAVIALCAFAAILWRVRPEAAPIALAILFASLPLWINGLTAARAEPFALAFFWGGAALVLLPRERFEAVAGGVGLAFVAISALWNPKWPLSSLVVFIFWMVRTRRKLLSAAVALLITIPAILALRLFATFGQLWFFVVEFNRANYPWLGKLQEGWSEGRSALFFAPLLLRPIVVVAAALIAVAVVYSSLQASKPPGLPGGQEARRPGGQPIVLFFLLLLIATVLELRFVFPYPVLWPYYFLMYAFAAAALVALAPFLFEAFLPRIAYAFAAALVIVVIANVVALAPLERGGDNGPYWTSQRYMTRNLRPGETVWIDIKRHPVGVRDESYYWFGFWTVMPSVLRTPHGARYLPPRTDLPFCAVLRGATTRVRFVSKPRLLIALPQEERCFQQLLASNRIRATPVTNLFEITR